MNIFKRRGKKKVPDVAVLNCVYRCLKEKCPWWVVLDTHYKEDKTGKDMVKTEGKCAIAWIPQLMIELKEAIKDGKTA